MITVSENNIIDAIEKKLYREFKNESSGHDFYHLKRVVGMTNHIYSQEKQGNLFILLLTAWLHDIGDYKLNAGIDKTNEKVRKILTPYDLNPSLITQVIKNIEEISFSKGLIPSTIEAKIVQDADRLDAIGAIGIARTFAYGGHKGHILYNPETPSRHHLSKEEYQKSSSSTFNHFYEKLFLLKNLMNTKIAKNIAEKRHQYMEEYVHTFLNDIEQFK